MRSFRTEIENPIVERDIIELEQKIHAFKHGKIDEEKFRSLRLARGVYGQRQAGVQMIRIKLPYGKMTVRQLRRICDVCDRYSTGNLHATTRQDIQIHYVSLDDTPELWAQLEKDEVTLREACGNTVRNVTGSPFAGIHPNEPFDITPYAHAFFSYFLRNPICQEMGRKFKVSFSANDEDDAFAFMHDLGFIPKINIENGQEVRGFKVLIGGGLGSQPRLADVAYEFLPADQIIPFAEGVLRVFDRHGERARRLKARMKYLLNNIGLEGLLQLVEEEKKALTNQRFPIETEGFETKVPANIEIPSFEIEHEEKFELWLKTNVAKQKQEGYAAVSIKLPLGDMKTDTARLLADIVEKYAGDDIRVTVNQGYVLRFIKKEHLPFVFSQLDALGLAEPGFNSTADITACPGTDTCNLAISSSTGISVALEKVIKEEYPQFIHDNKLLIKISGCMNGCGQHAIASIGFHGSSIKSKITKRVLPAIQILLGGGILGDGAGQVAEKVIKIPSKRGPDALRLLLEDYDANANEGEYYANYFNRQGKMYFYALLKGLGELEKLQESDYLDWGHDEQFVPEIGVGECAGVVIDLVGTLILEAKEKWEHAEEAFDQGKWADSIYHSYNTFVNGAKALLIGEGHKTNTQAKIIKDFQSKFVETGLLDFEAEFPELVYQIRKNPPSKDFAQSFKAQAKAFVEKIETHRQKELVNV